MAELPKPRNDKGEFTENTKGIAFKRHTENISAIKDNSMLLAGISDGIKSLVDVNKASLISSKKAAIKASTSSAKAAAKLIENERETSKLSKIGGSLKAGVSTVKDTAQSVAKGISLSGILTTLLGGVLLAAFFAPEKMKELKKSITEKISGVMDSEFWQSIGTGAWEIIKTNLNLPNLIISALFGWRKGLVVSAFTWVGKKLAEQIGGDKESDDWLEKSKAYISEYIPEIFTGVGLFAALMPGRFLKGMLGIFTGTAGFMSRSILGVFGVVKGLVTEEAVEKMIPRDAKGRFIKQAKATKLTMGKSLGRMLSVGTRALGVVGAMYAAYTIVDTIIEEANKAAARGKKALEDGKVPQEVAKSLQGSLDATEMSVARSLNARKTRQNDTEAITSQEQALIESIESQSGKKYTATKREKRKYGATGDDVFGKTIGGTAGPISDRVLRALAVYALSTENPITTKEKIKKDINYRPSQEKFELIYQEEVKEAKNLLTRRPDGQAVTPPAANNSLSKATDAVKTSSMDSYLKVVAKKESGGETDPVNARSKTSSASGKYQMTKGTFEGLVKQSKPGDRLYGKTFEDMQDSETLQNESMKILTEANMKGLEKAGFETSNSNMYLAHFLGLGGAKKALGADSNTLLTDVMSPAALKANSFLAKQGITTAGGLSNWAAGGFREAGGPETSTLVADTVTNAANNPIITASAPGSIPPSPPIITNNSTSVVNSKADQTVIQSMASMVDKSNINRLQNNLRAGG